jgi:hypothetical protein
MNQMAETGKGEQDLSLDLLPQCTFIKISEVPQIYILFEY